MKTRIILMIICSFILKTIIAQKYIPFPDSNAVWTVKNSECCPTSSIDYDLMTKGDTIINGNFYNLLQWQYGTIPSYAIRQDTLEKKVYIIYLNYLYNNNDTCFCVDSTEYLLYDFSLAKNDSVHIYFKCHYRGADVGVHHTFVGFKVFTVDSILLNGNYHKRMYLSNSQYAYMQFYWIEGVGSTKGPIYTQGFDFFEYIWELKCLKVNDETIFGTCESGINEIVDNESLCAFPNPVNDKLTVNLHKNEIREIRLLTMDGRLIRIIDFINNQKNISIDIANLPNGVYILDITFNNNLKIAQKIIKL